MYYNSVSNQAKVCVGGSWAAVGVPTVTSLPSNPSDGDEVYYRINRGDGTYGYWHLRYNASTTYWDFLGGPSLYAVASVSHTGSPGAQTAGSPSVSLPLSGEYDVNYGAADVVSDTSGDNGMRVYLVYNNNTGTPMSGVLVRGSVYMSAPANFRAREAGLASGNTLKAGYGSDSSQSSYFYGLFVQVAPLRVK
jgi:hypothetical protein